MDEYLLAQAGDAGALSVLIRRHSPLVKALCGRFRDCREDAFQWGCIGLVRAIRGFDPRKGFRFSTYAVPVILGEMQRARDQSVSWREAKKLRALRAYLSAQGENTPDAEAVSRALGMDKAEVVLLLERLQPPVEDTDGSLWSRVPDPQGERWMTRLLIRDILERMEQSETWLLCQRFIRCMSQKDVSRLLGVDASRVSRREKSARRHFIQAWTDSGG